MFLLSVPPEGALLLLCSDGVCDVMQPPAVLQAVRAALEAASAPPPPTGDDSALACVPTVAEALVEVARLTWSKRYPGVARDDITVQAIFLNGSAVEPTSTAAATEAKVEGAAVADAGVKGVPAPHADDAL